MNRGAVDKCQPYLPYAESCLIAGVLERMACFLPTGRPKSARLALLLLDRIVQNLEANPTVDKHGQHLRDVLENKPSDIALIPVPAERRMARPKPGPLLTWETRMEAA
jgi:hypothetical protein